MPVKKIYLLLVVIGFLVGCEKEKTAPEALALLQMFVGSQEINLSGDNNKDIPVDRPITLTFSSPVDQNAAANAISLKNDGKIVEINIKFSSGNSTLVIRPVGVLNTNTTYTLEITGALKGSNGAAFDRKVIQFNTVAGELELISAIIGGKETGSVNRVQNVPVDLTMTFIFSDAVKVEAFRNAVDLSGPDVSALEFSASDSGHSIHVSGASPLKYISRYKFSIANSLKGVNGETLPIGRRLCGV